MPPPGRWRRSAEILCARASSPAVAPRAAGCASDDGGAALLVRHSSSPVSGAPEQADRAARARQLVVSRSNTRPAGVREVAHQVAVDLQRARGHGARRRPNLPVGERASRRRRTARPRRRAWRRPRVAHAPLREMREGGRLSFYVIPPRREETLRQRPCPPGAASAAPGIGAAAQERLEVLALGVERRQVAEQPPSRPRPRPRPRPRRPRARAALRACALAARRAPRALGVGARGGGRIGAARGRRRGRRIAAGARRHGNEPSSGAPPPPPPPPPPARRPRDRRLARGLRLARRVFRARDRVVVRALPLLRVLGRLGLGALDRRELARALIAAAAPTGANASSKSSGRRAPPPPRAAPTSSSSSTRRRRRPGRVRCRGRRAAQRPAFAASAGAGAARVGSTSATARARAPAAGGRAPVDERASAASRSASAAAARRRRPSSRRGAARAAVARGDRALVARGGRLGDGSGLGPPRRRGHVDAVVGPWAAHDAASRWSAARARAPRARRRRRAGRRRRRAAPRPARWRAASSRCRRSPRAARHVRAQRGVVGRGVGRGGRVVGDARARLRLAVEQVDLLEQHLDEGAVLEAVVGRVEPGAVVGRLLLARRAAARRELVQELVAELGRGPRRRLVPAARRAPRTRPRSRRRLALVVVVASSSSLSSSASAASASGQLVAGVGAPSRSRRRRRRPWRPRARRARL